MNKLFLAIALMSAVLAANAQSGGFTYQDAANGVAVPAGTGATSPNGNILGSGLQVFTDLNSFLAAAPMATNSEDMETNNAGGVFQACPEPLDSSNNDNCFTPGQFVDGVQVSTTTGGGLVLLPPGFMGLSSSVLGAISFADNTLLDFTTNDIRAVAMDVYAGTVPGDVTLTLRDSGGATIGSATVMGLGPLPSNGFIGITSVTPIAQIEIDGLGGNGELFDNLLFGTINPLPDPPAVPALQPAGLFILVLVLAAASLLLLARRNTAK